jgi:hypothetical protein
MWAVVTSVGSTLALDFFENSGSSRQAKRLTVVQKGSARRKEFRYKIYCNMWPY